MTMTKLTMTNNVYRQYKSVVKDNETTTKEQANLKMTRNAELAVASVRPNGKGTHYSYGKLQFIVNEQGTVVWMKNHCKTPVGWKRDNVKYLKLNRELGIDDDRNMLDLVSRDVYLSVKKAFNKARYSWKKKVLETV